MRLLTTAEAWIGAMGPYTLHSCVEVKPARCCPNRCRGFLFSTSHYAAIQTSDAPDNRRRHLGCNRSSGYSSSHQTATRRVAGQLGRAAFGRAHYCRKLPNTDCPTTTIRSGDWTATEVISRSAGTLAVPAWPKLWSMCPRCAAAMVARTAKSPIAQTRPVVKSDRCPPARAALGLPLPVPGHRTVWFIPSPCEAPCELYVLALIEAR